jgi:processive 1,2-diacylglycerol beta-glucosyltransferase
MHRDFAPCSAPMKKVLILTAGYGEGHNSAARGVREGLECTAGGEVSVRVLDLFETCYGRVNAFVKKAYLSTINNAPKLWATIYELLDSTKLLEVNLIGLVAVKHELERLLEEEHPCAVVSTYPVYNYLLDAIRTERAIAHSFAQITIVTDSITVNSVWHRCTSDVFIVANEETADVMHNAGVPREKVCVLGFPVTPKFSLERIEREMPGKAPGRLLFMINFGKKEAPELLRHLLTVPDIVVTVTVGRDPELEAKVREVAQASGRPVEVHGWTDKLPLLMMSHHLIISKAGGATVQEATAAGTPLVMSQVVPGQEEGNAQLILNHECGALAETPEAIIGVVREAFANDAALLRRWMLNIERLSRPDAALNIGRFILDRCGAAAG